MEVVKAREDKGWTGRNMRGEGTVGEKDILNGDRK